MDTGDLSLVEIRENFNESSRTLKAILSFRRNLLRRQVAGTQSGAGSPHSMSFFDNLEFAALNIAIAWLIQKRKRLPETGEPFLLLCCSAGVFARVRPRFAVRTNWELQLFVADTAAVTEFPREIERERIAQSNRASLP